MQVIYTWIIVILDWDTYRTPQEMREEHEVRAPSAEDAITIAKLRFRFPWRGSHADAEHTRMLSDVRVKEL